VRADKITLAALAATLRLYRDPATAELNIPFLSLLSTPVENLQNRAERLAPQMAQSPAVASATACAAEVSVVEGAAPSPTWCVALEPKGESLENFARRLRIGAPSVIGRMDAGQLVLDLRSVTPALDIHLVDAVLQLGGEKPL
jgi:L-seryl-tRNA(Ser) seleniumtransferase